MSIQSLIEADRKHLIHPVINYRAHEARGVTVLDSASGAFLRDADGNELLDAFSGLWCVNVGYGQPSIVKVAAEQMARLPYATSYFHFGNAPAIDCKQLEEAYRSAGSGAVAGGFDPRGLMAMMGCRPMKRLMPTGLPGPSSTNSTFGSFNKTGGLSPCSSNFVTPLLPTTCSGGMP